MMSPLLLTAFLSLLPEPCPSEESVGDGKLEFLSGIWHARGWAQVNPRTRQQLDAWMVIAPWTDGLLSGYVKHSYQEDDLPPDFDDFTETGLRSLEPSTTGFWLWDREAEDWVSLAGWRPDYVERALPFEDHEGALVADSLAGTDSMGSFEDTLRFEAPRYDEWSFGAQRRYSDGTRIQLCQVLAERRGDGIGTIEEPVVGGGGAQVTTLLDGFRGSRALAIDGAGTLYFAGALGDEEGAPIRTRSPAGELEIFAEGLAPAGLVWRGDHLYVHAHDVEGGRVVRIDRSGTIEHLGRLPGDPLAVDRQGRVFTIVGEQILQLQPEGEPQVWFESPLLQGGFAFTADDRTDSLIVGTWGGGAIYRVRRDREPELLGHIPGSARGRCAWITMDGADILATSFGGSRVYRLTPGKGATLVAGRGLVGDDDGAGRNARFHNPNGIALTPDGRTIYIAEIRPGPQGPFSLGRLRAIELP